ncbi:hypothetical protein QBC47DRAFT_5308 [Echria macrotheca]|uniref:Uncharacterized protein n=1 Tax=Echria macrotheca TaxID=438768 RepID=A0AAJ0BNG5_9PEZI|nr:hypothetical protein QBC47DRAFT_5308 [Echria macrotheca]
MTQQVDGRAEDGMSRVFGPVDLRHHDSASPPQSLPAPRSHSRWEPEGLPDLYWATGLGVLAAHLNSIEDASMALSRRDIAPISSRHPHPQDPDMLPPVVGVLAVDCPEMETEQDSKWEKVGRLDITPRLPVTASLRSAPSSPPALDIDILLGLPSSRCYGIVFELFSPSSSDRGAPKSLSCCQPKERSFLSGPNQHNIVCGCGLRNCIPRLRGPYTRLQVILLEFAGRTHIIGNPDEAIPSHIATHAHHWIFRTIFRAAEPRPVAQTQPGSEHSVRYNSEDRLIWSSPAPKQVLRLKCCQHSGSVTEGREPE